MDLDDIVFHNDIDTLFKVHQKIIGCFMMMMTLSITIFPGIGNKKIY